jgi:serine/threonine protein kinase
MPATMKPDRQCPRCGTKLPKDAPEGLCPTCLIQAGIGTDPGVTKPDPDRDSNRPPPSPQEIAPSFPQLEIFELIGQGGMGIVYKARQPKLDRIVALKILPLELGRDPAFAERFAREARALARLNHPHIVAIYDFGELNGLYYFLMEHVDGVSLRQLESSRRLSPEQALSMVPRICDALQYAHEEGIVHRDIKPGNILLDKKGRVKIADFGLAKLVGAAPDDLSLTGAGQSMGTPHYMAPEQIHHSGQVDHRADIYSLGVVFYEMLTGELPVGRFAAPSRKVQVDVRLDDIVLRALENNPERRYQQASEIKTDVESIARHPPPRIAAEAHRQRERSAASPPSDLRNLARQSVYVPGTALLIYGIVNLVSLLIPAVLLGFRMSAWFQPALPAIHGWPFSIPLGFDLANPILPLAVAICLLVGASRLRNLTSYNWAFAAALLALLPPPLSWLWPIGLGLGVWTLIVIHQTEVKSAFGRELPGQPPHPTSGPGASGSSVIPIISRKAILGACLMAVSVLLGLVGLTPLMWRMSLDNSLHIANAIRFGLVRGEVALQVALLRAYLPWWILLFGIPIATTILGLVAIKDIRYSNGRIIGLSLALVDALVFPLLLMNGLVFVSLYQVLRSVGLDPGWMAPADALLFILSGALLCVVLDCLIFRACWRAARRPVV